MINKAPIIAFEKGHLSLMTLRSHDQFNTTVYSTNDRYRGIKNQRKIIFMNPQDIEKQGLKDGDLVNIKSHATDNIKREVEGFKVISYDIKQGCCASYFPEATPLVSLNIHDPKSFTPSYKLIDITVQKA